jgi:hypothetical protein
MKIGEHVCCTQVRMLSSMNQIASDVEQRTDRKIEAVSK